MRESLFIRSDRANRRAFPPPQKDRTETTSASVELVDVFSAVLRVADQAPTAEVNHEIEVFQRQLADQYRNSFRYLHDVHGATPPLDGEPHRFIQCGLGGAGAAQDPFGADLGEAE